MSPSLQHSRPGCSACTRALCSACTTRRRRLQAGLLIAVILIACTPSRVEVAVASHVSRALEPTIASTERATSLAGPVPDFAPMRAIVTHERAAEMAPELVAVLNRLLGSAHVTARHEWPAEELDPGETTSLDDSVMWLRDYMPVYVRQPNGHTLAWYTLAENENRTGYRSSYDGLSTAERRTLPLIVEHGNLVSTGTQLFASEQLLSENAEHLDDDHLLERGYRPRNEREVRRLLAHASHRRPDDLVLLPAMPYESTGHIDLFLLALDADTVVVPAIEEEALESEGAGLRQRIGKVVQVFLDEQSDYLASLGLEVVRLPMVPPVITTDVDASEDDEQAFELLVFSPANSLLVNVGGRRRVIVPSFSTLAENPRVAALFARYTAAWMKMFRSRGWEAHSADASGLVSYLGLFRCVSAPVPEAAAAPATAQQLSN